MVRGFGGLTGVIQRLQTEELRNQVRSLQTIVSAGGGERTSSEETSAEHRSDGSRLRAAELVKSGLQLKRSEVADYLGVSTRKIQRMEAAGTLRRCPNLGTVVRYAARDVLRLASAS